MVVAVRADVARSEAGHDKEDRGQDEREERLKHPTDDQPADQGLLEIGLVQFASSTHAPGSEWKERAAGQDHAAQKAATHERGASRGSRVTGNELREPKRTPRLAELHIESLELLERRQRRLHELGLPTMTFQ